MNFNGYTPHEFSRWSSLCDLDDSGGIPMGLSPLSLNIKYHLTSAGVRDGIQSRYGFIMPGAAYPVTGLASLKYQASADTQFVMAFDSSGQLAIESPVGSSQTAPVTDPNGLVALPAAAHAQITPAYNRAYIAFSDLITGLALPCVYDLSAQRLDPYSMKQFGQKWTASTKCFVGEVNIPTTVGGNGHTYRCTTAGTTGITEPAWPVGAGNTIADGTCVWTENTASAADSGVGVIAAGQHFFVVLFVNKNSYITGMSEGSVMNWTAVGSKQVTISNIPLGPANTMQRIVAFTVAGGTSAGPYFYIPSSDVVSGVTETSTVINDNTSTSAIFSFDDTYLISQSATEVSVNFNKMQIPACTDIYYSKNLQRMIISGAVGYPSSVLISPVTDPETILANNGIVAPGENDSQRVICARDFSGTTYIFKEESGYTLEPNANAPSSWSATLRWTGSGPCGPRAIHHASLFICFVHRTGIYIFRGGKPLCISTEIPLTLKRVNWNYASAIWVHIDEETKEIRIGVPLDKSTVPSHILKCNYVESEPTDAEPGFMKPFHKTLQGDIKSSDLCRKWSIDDIPAYVCIRAIRKLNDPNGKLNPGFRQTQTLLASSNPDGAVCAITPDQYDDNGIGINAVYETSAPSQLMPVQQLGGVKINADGYGFMDVEVLAGRAKAAADGGNPQTGTEIKLRQMDFVKERMTGYQAGARGQNQRFRLRVSNGKRPGHWFDIKWAAILARPVFSAGKG